jgi:predicted deacylase
MRVGNLAAKPGEHVYGELAVGASRSGLAPNLPVHLFCGAEPGPTLLVQGAIHGTEFIGSICILNFVQRLDPQRLHGNVIAVPVLNRMGFERSERISPIDHKDIGRLFPGNPKGSLSDRIAYLYFHEVIAQANVLIDFHQGGLASYERYVLFTAEQNPQQLTEMERKRRVLVIAFGLDVAAFFPPDTFKENTSQAIADAGVIQFTPELGGGTGWLGHGEENVAVGERGIWNTLKAMQMIDGEMEADGPLCTVYNAGIVFWKPPVNGLFVRCKQIGEVVRLGEVYGTIIDPYTGELLAELVNEQAEAVVIPGGREWPVIGDTSVGILGVVDRVEDRRTLDLRVHFP